MLYLKFFSIKKSCIKKAALHLITLFFVFSVPARDIPKNDPYEVLDEGIVCEDITSALYKYNQDIRLNQQALKSALRDTVHDLRKVLETEEGLSTKEDQAKDRIEILKMIRGLREAQSLSQENEMLLSSRGIDIVLSIEDCLHPPEANQ